MKENKDKHFEGKQLTEEELANVTGSDSNNDERLFCSNFEKDNCPTDRCYVMSAKNFYGKTKYFCVNTNFGENESYDQY